MRTREYGVSHLIFVCETVDLVSGTSSRPVNQKTGGIKLNIKIIIEQDDTENENSV